MNIFSYNDQLILSIAIRVIALLWSIVLVIRIRSWKMGLLTLMILLMSFQQSMRFFAIKSELPGFIVSILVLLVVVFVGKLILKQKLDQQKLKEINEGLEQRVQERTRELNDRNTEVQRAYDDLKMVQAQLLQQDKMASVGQLAAGVAHEINNPISFIISNLGTLAGYVEKLSAYLDVDAKVLSGSDPAISELVAQERQKYKIDRICKDMPDLIAESSEGAQRVRRIVQDLKNFSRGDGGEFAFADIHAGLESTLSIASSELKYKTTILRDYGQLSPAWCNIGQLNQVFLNILVNAAHAIADHGEIRLTTREEDNSIRISISDTGGGIAPEHLKRIFDPFFTTKEVGKGTGLGLAIAYDIVVNKHGGRIDVQSEVGVGTTFTIILPLAGAAGGEN